ncbi:hypothetical protein G3570_08955 [Balneolaceae bacterium YR4-1]|uniref:Tetratricopeptide repeat protein n=1 Tax=Halalkalibaculum roseum TaxID=2709311 RepID=A0A6M1SUY7_9BACT|nr:hypothetical protein [Halalkalibaculum roseum]NGP76760.1 hypothetical protein [Halalkalibaculum roseum]
MRLIGLLLIICFVLSSCTSSRKLLEKGKYDHAIEKSVKALRKDPGDTKEFNVLKEAYQKANYFDNDRIAYLKNEGRSENWLEIYTLYSQLESRQNWIESLPGNLPNRFELVDYDEYLIDSKENAAEFAYQKGIEYLDRGDKESARLAYREFEEVQYLYGDYKNVAQHMQEARFLGTSHVLFRVENNSEVLLPRDFDYELRKISLKDLNDQWTNYDTYADTSLVYDYYIELNLNDIRISPERIDKESYTETAEIQDGLKYVFDQNGNVKKDSLGNDIKVPNMITVSADITESRQFKHGIISGSLDYIDLNTDQLLKTEDISVDAIFEHFSAVYSGNEKALTEETKRKLRSRPVPFPSDESLLLDAAELLKNESKAFVLSNRNVLLY